VTPVDPGRNHRSPEAEGPARSRGSTLGRGDRGRYPRRFLAVGLLVASLAGCLRDLPPPSDPELAEALGLPPRTPIHRVDLVDRDGRVGVFPLDVELDPGAVLQFVTRDQRVYSVHFEREGMAPGAWAFLERTGQTDSAPLTREGARFVVSFADAPPGPYPFRVEGQARPARGEVRVGGSP
jgi:hypothetical protein